MYKNAAKFYGWIWAQRRARTVLLEAGPEVGTKHVTEEVIVLFTQKALTSFLSICN